MGQALRVAAWPRPASLRPRPAYRFSVGFRCLPARFNPVFRASRRHAGLQSNVPPGQHDQPGGGAVPRVFQERPAGAHRGPPVNHKRASVSSVRHPVPPCRRSISNPIARPAAPRAAPLSAYTYHLPAGRRGFALHSNRPRGYAGTPSRARHTLRPGAGLRSAPPGIRAVQ